MECLTVLDQLKRYPGTLKVRLSEIKFYLGISRKLAIKRMVAGKGRTTWPQCKEKLKAASES